jgi:hypothetical protein
MKRPIVLVGIALAWLAVLPAAAKEAAKQSARPPIVDARADALLRAMGDTLAEARQFSFQARIEQEEVLPTGQKIEYGGIQDVAVRRPDRAYVEFQGDSGTNRLWYDGKQVTILDGEERVFAVAPMPGKLDGAIDRLHDQYGIWAPLSPLLYGNPYANLREHVQFGSYLGETDIGGVRCHHLAFVEKDVDWQIWIEDGTQIVPCKVVVTHTLLPGQPRFAATFSDWELDARLADVLFRPMLPPDAARIDFLEASKQVEERK